MVKRYNVLLSLDQFQRDSVNGDEEFDFSDVFGPIQQKSDDYQPDETPRSSQKIDSRDAKSFASWAPLDSISRGQPLVIHNRCHSMVGPTYGLPASLGRLPGMFEALQMRIDPKEGRALSDASAKAQSSLQILEENFPAPMDLMKTSAGSISKIGPQDFELLRVVGQGAFGKVFQVEKKDSAEILAMKVMSKSRIKEKNHEEYMKAERDILTKAMHPFIVQLHYSFQTKSKLYLIMDFINGGHLFFQLYRKGTFNEELARIYTAEIVLAVVHLHDLGIMHRDLKPENILLDSDGHVKITDFGLSKEVSDSDVSNSLCGTVEYMAPEIILGKGHGKGADWWSVGILLYEMLTGQPPFSHKNRQKLQQKIVKEKVKIPTYLTTEASNLLKGLLQKDPEKRLGYGPEGGEAIKKHKWFKAINWKKLEQKEIQPKFVPTVNGKHCIANFDEKWTTMPVLDSPAGTPTSEGIDIANFKGYSYAAPRQYLPTVDSDDNEEDECESNASDVS